MNLPYKPIGMGILAGIAIISVLMAYSAYRSSRDDRIRMEQVIEDQRKVIADSRQAQEDNNRKLADALEEINRQRAAVRTPEQAARAIPQVIPGVQPIIIPAQPSSPGQPAVINLPKFELPAEQMKILYDFAQTCHECEVKLTASNADRQELVRQMQAIGAQRDSAIKAVKGGTLWTRLKRNAKWFGLGAAIGAGAVAATR